MSASAYKHQHYTNFVDIISLTRENCAAYKALRLKAIVSDPFALWPTYEEEAALTQAQIRERIEPGPNQIVFGAFDVGRLVGIAGLKREKLEQIAHRATVWGVAVDPDHREQGIAKKLLQRLIAHARDQGVLQIQLAVAVENRPAQALYRSLGFKSFGVEPRAMRVGTRFYDEEHMVLRLDR
jgi:ribosomal protein S18 acetylase RimI-like enzyme